jgi:hypothetical protein
MYNEERASVIMSLLNAFNSVILQVLEGAKCSLLRNIRDICNYSSFSLLLKRFDNVYAPQLWFSQVVLSMLYRAPIYHSFIESNAPERHLRDHAQFIEHRIQEVINEDVIHSRALFVSRTQQCFAVKTGIDGYLDIAREVFCSTSEGINLLLVDMIILHELRTCIVNPCHDGLLEI